VLTADRYEALIAKTNNWDWILGPLAMKLHISKQFSLCLEVYMLLTMLLALELAE